MLKTTRYGVYHRGELLRSFDTMREAENYAFRLPWNFPSYLTVVKSFVVDGWTNPVVSL
jgi:hypothetical protein